MLFKSTNWSEIDLPRLNWSVILEVYIYIYIYIYIYLVFLSQPCERYKETARFGKKIYIYIYIKISAYHVKV